MTRSGVIITATASLGLWALIAAGIADIINGGFSHG